MEKENQDKKINHILKLAILVMVGFACMMLVFSVGIWTGERRAEFSFQWAQNYHRNFGGPATGIFGNFPARDFTNSHGIFGPVVSVDQNTIIVKGQDNVEKTIVVSTTTMIRKNSSMLAPGDLKIGDTIVVVGSPNGQGQIEAKFIRVLPPASSFLHTINDNI